MKTVILEAPNFILVEKLVIEKDENLSKSKLRAYKIVEIAISVSKFVKNWFHVKSE